MPDALSIPRLPAYPSTSARKSLSPTQLSTLTSTIASVLSTVLVLPPTKLDSPSALSFVASYAKDTALVALQSLIWTPTSATAPSQIQIQIHKRTLRLAHRLAPRLGLLTLLDLSLAYAPSSQLRAVFSSAYEANPGLALVLNTDFVPALTHLLNPSQGLYATRKATQCALSFLRSSPAEFKRCFAHSQVFVLALAHLYDQGLAGIALSYGGLSVQRGSGKPHDWEPTWAQTKLAVVDAFHLLIRVFLDDLASARGAALAVESERTFGVVFALLEVPASSSSGTTPFLDRPLLADYQATYSLSTTLSKALSKEDARVDVLESALSSLSPASNSRKRDPGALNILLGSGVPPGVDARSSSKGKERATERGHSPEAHDPDIDLKLTQILDILPDTSPSYARALLRHPPFAGDPEKVIGALLEGSAPLPESAELTPGGGGGGGGKGEERDRWGGGDGVDETLAIVVERRNVFDEVEMDLGSVRVGKKREDAFIALRDHAAIAALKADILRRAETISDSDDEDQTRNALAYDSDEVIKLKLKLGGEGEQSDESNADSDADGGDQDPEPGKAQDVQTILELAYIADLALFARDARTRHGAERKWLRKQAGWDPAVFKVGLPSVLFGITLQSLSNRGVLKSTLPTWLVVSGSVFFGPTISVLRTIYKGFDDRRQAAKLEARLARTIRGKSIGNVDILATMRRLWDTGYIGKLVNSAYSTEVPIMVAQRTGWLTASPDRTQ
ncbi:hypothetical protein DXG01_012223 [Tephrocybe rancida]|nr:hypothetical protein DXG01_012223 [Tephrocybe rancida]